MELEVFLVDGYFIGGFFVGEDIFFMYEIIEYTVVFLLFE